MLKGFIYEPIRHPKSSRIRRDVVINQMSVTKHHYISSEEAERLKSKPLITNYKKIDENVGVAPYFRSVLAGLLRVWCKSNKNPKTDEPYNLYRDGLKIYTTIDSRMQDYAERAVEAHMPDVQKKLNYSLKLKGDKLWKGRDNIIRAAMKFTDRWKTMQEEGIDSADIVKTFHVPVKMKIFSWSGDKNHEKDTFMTPYDSIKYHKQILQTSFAAMDPRTGEVKAWVGGINFKWFKYDHVTASRQVGSTIKPLLYTLAVTDAGYGPDTYIPGGPLTLSGKTISSKGGSMAYCLANSLNGAAWRLIAAVGVKRMVDFGKQCGITAKLPPYPSIALGAAEIPMLQMLQAYTMFPNKGYNTPPVYVTRIEDKDGNLIFEFPLSQSKELISESENYTMVKMMQGVIKFGTGRRLNSYNIPAEMAGKTGTTNGNTDGWFIGYTPEILAGTWVGCEDPFIPIYSNNSGGAEMAGPNWGSFMSQVYNDKRLPYGGMLQFEQPAELKNDPIYAESNFENIVKSGDSLNIDESNGSADDFMGDENGNTDALKSTPKSQDSGKNKSKPQAPKATTSSSQSDYRKKK
jgi:penicillin-binding protein 1A